MVIFAILYNCYLISTTTAVWSILEHRHRICYFRKAHQCFQAFTLSITRVGFSAGTHAGFTPPQKAGRSRARVGFNIAISAQCVYALKNKILTLIIYISKRFVAVKKIITNSIIGYIVSIVANDNCYMSMN